MSTTVPGTRYVAMINGRCWQFEHEGTLYQLIALNGTENVRLYYRLSDTDRWQWGYTRDTNGESAALVARQMYEDVTAPAGTDYAREWLAHNTILSRQCVRALSNEDVMTEVTGRYPGGRDGMLRHIGAIK